MGVGWGGGRVSCMLSKTRQKEYKNLAGNTSLYFKGETLNYRSGAVAKEWLKTVF